MKKGFTLIELLVIVLIIAILAGIALPMYQKAVLESRFAGIIPRVHGMEQALGEYYLNNGYYKLDLEAFSLGIQTGSSCADGGAFCQIPATNALRVEFLIGSGVQTANYYGVYCLASINNTIANNICAQYGTHYKTDQMEYYKMKTVRGDGTVTYHGENVPF